MMLNGIKILIGDDSILAKKAVKGYCFHIWYFPVFLKLPMDKDAIDLYKKESPELVFLILSCS